jgi:hypothetical protein
MQRDLNPELFWPDGTVRSQNNAFTGHGYTCSRLDMSAESAAARAGANAAATKRARGQDLMPKLYLKGSKPRSRRVREEVACEA